MSEAPSSPPQPPPLPEIILRGIGVADTALAIAEGRPANASGALALHVLEIMEAFAKSAKEKRAVDITTSPGPDVPLDWSAEKGKLKTLV